MVETAHNTPAVFPSALITSHDTAVGHLRQKQDLQDGACSAGCVPVHPLVDTVDLKITRWKSNRWKEKQGRDERGRTASCAA